MQQRLIPFQEHLVPFGQAAAWDAYRKISTSGKVPCLVDGTTIVWDSLAITEYLAERHKAIWPQDVTARAWARSTAAEMHSGFAELRGRCPMSCGHRIRLNESTSDLQRDLDRISTLWTDGLTRFGGPFLAGRDFSAVDAFFAPVAFRIQTYGIKLTATSMTYAKRLLELKSMQDWYAAALNEKLRDESHDIEIMRVGTVIEDLRVAADG